MSIKNNPCIITDGLVLDVDLSSTRSYVGPPIKNIATSIYQNYGDQSNSTFKIANGTETVNIPTLGKVTTKYVDVYNDYNGGSGQCCPSLYSFGGDMATNASTVHTYAIVYKSMNEYTNANYMYRYEYNGATYVLESGIFDTAKRIHLGDGWYWAWNTFTTNAATTRFNYIAFFMYEYLKYNRISVAKVLLCQGDYSTLHPRYWPEVNTTRSTSQALKDLTGRSTITATGLTYTNGKITIPNTNGAYFDVSTPTNFKMGVQDFTISCWVKQLDSGVHVITEARDSSTLQGYLFGLNVPSAGYMTFFLNKVTGQVPYYTAVGTLPVGSIQNIVAVVKRSNSTIEFYANGVLFDTITGIHADSISGTGDMYRVGFDRGGGTANIELYAYNHYNKALTAAEVVQNFNAKRGLYGV